MIIEIKKSVNLLNTIQLIKIKISFTITHIKSPYMKEVEERILVDSGDNTRIKEMNVTKMEIQ